MVREDHGNIWELQGDAVCVTTNGIVKEDGRAVMGAGIAKQCLEKYPGVDRVYGNQIKLYGVKIHTLVLDFVTYQRIVAFPTKQHWQSPSDLSLIERSAKQLMSYTELNNLTNVLLPRPGCGLGGLEWSEVKELLTPILDERIIVVDYA